MLLKLVALPEGPCCHSMSCQSQSQLDVYHVCLILGLVGTVCRVGSSPSFRERTQASVFECVCKRAACVCLFWKRLLSWRCLPVESCLSAMFVYLAECRKGQERQVQAMAVFRAMCMTVVLGAILNGSSCGNCCSRELLLGPRLWFAFFTDLFGSIPNILSKRGWIA